MKVTVKAHLNTTWDKLKKSNHLPSGSIIPITLKNGDSIEVDVARDATGKTFFVFHDCYGKHRMNKERTNEGGWEESDMRRYANEEIFELFPDDLQEVIVPTKIVQIWDGRRHETEDKLFCLSETQVFGTGAWSNDQDPEDTQLDVFKTKRDRVKNLDGETYPWWLRSAYNTNNFSYVNSNGNENNNNANNSNGLVLGFNIGFYRESKYVRKSARCRRSNQPSG